MPIFHVENFTMYNTSDILAMFELVEAAVLQNVGNVEPTYQRHWHREGERVPLFVTFKDYVPANPARKKTEWINSKKSVTYDRAFVKVSNRPSTDVRLLTPDKLWSNPLEALAAAKEGSTRAPHGMVEALVSRLGYLYDVNRWGKSLYYTDPDASHLSLRIEAKTQEKLGAAERARAARARANTSLDDALFVKTKLDEYAERMKQGVDRSFGHLRRAKVPFSDKETALQMSVAELFATMQNLEDALRACKAP